MSYRIRRPRNDGDNILVGVLRLGMTINRSKRYLPKRIGSLGIAISRDIRTINGNNDRSIPLLHLHWGLVTYLLRNNRTAIRLLNDILHRYHRTAHNNALQMSLATPTRHIVWNICLHLYINGSAIMLILRNILLPRLRLITQLRVINGRLVPILRLLNVHLKRC